MYVTKIISNSSVSGRSHAKFLISKSYSTNQTIKLGNNVATSLVDARVEKPLMDRLSQELNIKEMSDWYKISYQVNNLIHSF